MSKGFDLGGLLQQAKQLQERLTSVQDEIASLKEDADLAHELGFDAFFVADVPFAGGPGIRFSDQARFHPRKYLAALAAAVRAQGGQIFEHSGAEQFTRTRFASRPTDVGCDAGTSSLPRTIRSPVWRVR